MRPRRAVLINLRQPFKAFAVALAVLLLTASVTAVTINRLRVSEQSVRHTLEVQAALGTLASDLTRAGFSRTMFISTGNPGFLEPFSSVQNDSLSTISEIRRLTSDRP